MGRPKKRTRMSAEERRAVILTNACHAFSRLGFRSATTAQIARESGISEPILYEHFGSKRDLYVACVSATWHNMRDRWDAAIANEIDPSRWTLAIAAGFEEVASASPEDGPIDIVTDLWARAIVEPTTDDALRDFLSDHVRELHGYVAGVYIKAQQMGGIRSDCDPDSEAWILIAIGLLRSSDGNVGGVVAPHFAGIIKSRRAWLTGSSAT